MNIITAILQLNKTNLHITIKQFSHTKPLSNFPGYNTITAFLRHKNTEHSPKKAVLTCFTLKFTHFCKLVLSSPSYSSQSHAPHSL